MRTLQPHANNPFSFLSKFGILSVVFFTMGIIGCQKETLQPEENKNETNVNAKGKPGGGGGGGGSISFSGQATAISANVLGLTTTLSQTAPLPSAGGACEASLLSANILGVLSTQVLHAATIGQGNCSRSEASVVNLNLSVGGVSVGAGLLMSRAKAVCTSGSSSVSGSSEIVALTIGGLSVTASGSPNQTINLLLGKVIINEQVISPGSITVNALHVIVYGVADIVISSSHADIVCGGSPVCQGGDFVTGGGWVTGTPSGAKGTFGVAGGIKNGYWGHLTYIDHGIGGPKVKGTGITNYVVVNTTTRRIEGTCEINGQGGYTYVVIVADKGEPGRDDTFDLTLSNGYHAAGNLPGGNIQLHRPCK